MNKKAIGRLFRFPVILVLFLFLPAGTFEYWQAWLFIAVLFLCSSILTVYLALHDPKLLERRLEVGPTAEKESSQKAIMLFSFLSFAGLLVASGLDRRLGWSHMADFMTLLGEVLIILGFIAVFFVLRENSFAAATIQISDDQKVISTGPYSLVRHPMYSGGLVLLFGVPLALGSWWAMLALIPTYTGIVWRLLDEEKFLTKNLPGYPAYLRKVRYRLIPWVW